MITSESIGFTELARLPLGQNMFLVVSRRTDSKFSIAKQVVADTDEGSEAMFKKNSLVFASPGLVTLVQASILTLIALSHDELGLDYEFVQKLKHIV